LLADFEDARKLRVKEWGKPPEFEKVKETNSPSSLQKEHSLPTP